MRTVGLITEYNPFHNGHLYHIQRAKDLTKADNVIVIMSGCFVQRGIPAVMDKQLRTKMALSCGADIVIELPAVFSCASAEIFALGAVSLLNSTNCVDYLCFGSECADISTLVKAANILLEEPPLFKRLLKDNLKLGHSFPSARQKAVIGYMSEKADIKSSFFESLSEIFSRPNNILGFEYIKAIIKLNSKIKPVTIKRITADYNENEIKDNNICSATAIRNCLAADSLSSFKTNVPESIYEIMEDSFNKTFPIFEDDFSLLLKFKLLMLKDCDLTQYSDVSNELSNTIKNNIYNFKTFSDFANLLKSRQYTLTRINRALTHILLDIKKDDMERYIENVDDMYLRILGFNKNSSLLKELKKNSSLPIISKLADSKRLLSKGALNALNKDIFAADLYRSVITNKFNTLTANEYVTNIVITPDII